MFFVWKLFSLLWVVQWLCTDDRQCPCCKTWCRHFFLLRYCNIDLLKPHSFWDSTITLLCLTLLTESQTRITPTSATLTDHIIQTTQMHSQRSLYLTWASVTIAPSPVQNLFNFQNVNSKPILLDRSSTLIAVCKFFRGWRSYGLKPFYFVHCLCLYIFLQLFVRHIVP